jgi:hypothetical protein
MPHYLVSSREKKKKRLLYSGCQKYVPFAAIFLSWQGVSLFESGQFPPPLVGGIMHGTL